jgi:hypothetical protein
MKNQTSKYFKYAIGEIVLVVIGILIALQINNWNENRKQKKQEVQILMEIKSDLFQTKNHVLETVSEHKEVLGLAQYLLNAIYDKAPYSDSIYGAFSKAGIDYEVVPKTSGFENLKTIGLNTISDDSLRIAITNIFQLSFTRLQNDFQIKNQEFDLSSTMFPYQKNYFVVDFSKPRKRAQKYSDTLNTFGLKIKDYQHFLNDEELFKVIQLSMYTRSRIIERQMNVVEEIDKVVELIEQELEKKNAK